MTRAVVSVATTPYYQRGQERLWSIIQPTATWFVNWQREPDGCPKHSDVPYAMKAYALQFARKEGMDLLLWCDACMIPVASMEPLWERIERDGYWMSRNGFRNYDWTADSAYPDLFPEFWRFDPDRLTPAIDDARLINRQIPHVVATCFGLNVRHPKGRAFLDEYYRLASETRAFCGPWTNAANLEAGRAADGVQIGYCGPRDVRGHRHDQTAASVIAWRLGFELTDPPQIFAYGRADEQHDPRTIMLADGSYQ